MNPFNGSTIEDHVFLHPVSMLLGTKFDVICHHFMVCLYVLNINESMIVEVLDWVIDD